MTRASRRPPGVAALAGFLWLRSATLILAAAAPMMKPEIQGIAATVVEILAPSAQQLHVADTNISIAPLLALFEGMLGIGIWAQKRWARRFMLGDLVCRFTLAAMGASALLAIDSRRLFSIVSMRGFAFGLLANLLIFAYLIRPEAAAVFGDDE